MVVYVKNRDKSAGVVYKVKSTGPSTEPCGTPYESMTLSEKVSLIFYGLEPIF